ncbi:substrate-binding periplasmic protein [Spelaeicoccus albus]|nr:transporter substrate-binding domain-containing protein [Spelaeicoccus albus]
MMHRRIVTRLAIGLLAIVPVALSGCSAGGSGGESGPNTLQTIEKRGTLRVAVLPDFPPTSVKKPSGKIVGYAPDIAKELAKALGVKLKMVPVNGDERLSVMKSKRADVNISAYTATNERAKKVAFTIPYKSQGAGVLFRKDDPITSVKDLAGKKVAVARGSTNDTIITDDFPKAKPVRFDSIAHVLQALKSNKVDAAMETYYVTHQNAKKNSALKALDVPPIKPDLISMGVLPDQQQWLNYLDNFIRNLISQGDAQKLHKKWFDEDLSPLVKNYG